MPRGIPNPVAGQEAGSSEPALSPRAQSERRERRERLDGDLDKYGSRKLAVPPEVEARWQREGKVGRWMLDTDDRLSNVYRMDWDKTPEVSEVSAGGEKGEKLILHEKYQEWYEERQAKKRAINDERMDLIGNSSRHAANRQSGDGLVVPRNQTNSLTQGPPSRG